jgi:Domain of unknown function (DUF4333)
MQTRGRLRVSVGPLIAAAFTFLALAGCGTSLNDPTGLVKQLFRQKTGMTASSVSCPTGIPIAKGHQFTCTVRAQGHDRSVTVEEMTATSGGLAAQIIGVN